MRLSVKQNGRQLKEFEFLKGPISIGRVPDNKVHLAAATVSKKHAVIHRTKGLRWYIEDLKSSNKTYLNGVEVEKAVIKPGDKISITNFVIEVLAEDGTGLNESVQAEALLGDSQQLAGTEDVNPMAETQEVESPGEAGEPTVIITPESSEAKEEPDPSNESHQIEATLNTPLGETVVRKPDAHHAPAMRLDAQRLNQFSWATEQICIAESLVDLIATLLKVLTTHFAAFHVWVAIKDNPKGPIILEAGKKRTGQKMTLSDLPLSEKITEVMERGQSLVMPRVSAQMQKEAQIRSVLIASIKRSKGCFGVLYVDNAMVHDHYSLSDLDYLMLLAMHTAAVLRSHDITG